MLSVFFLVLLVDFKLYEKANQLPESWDSLPHHDLFLKTKFLQALESSCPKNITPYYVGVFKNKQLVGIAIIQRVQMYLDDAFRNNEDSFFTKKVKQIVSKIARGNALVVGNLMHTGQHGLFFLETELSYSSFLNVINEAIIDIKKEIKFTYKKKIRIIAFKDYFEDDIIHNNQAFFRKQNLYKVEVQPNMILVIKEQWKTFEDYKRTFVKKYRQRYNSAKNKSKTIEKKELNLEAIRLNESKIFELYKTVSDNARVNSFILNKYHFSNLKENLKENLKLFGYFLDNEFIGFYTLIINNKTLETYFLGYNKEFQQKHKIYLNMLFDMVQFGIENNFKHIVYARTAMEIKSSIGAKPKTMHIYMKHTNRFIANTILKFIVKYLNPTTQWQERNPFKV